MRKNNRFRTACWGFLFATVLLVGMAPGADCTRTSVGFLPLNDLGAGLYQGYPGGLYPEGSNDRPPDHEALGLALALNVQPLDQDGNPDPIKGKIVLLSVGMSNATQEFSAFQRLAARDRALNPKLVIVDGAQGGQTAAIVSRPETPAGARYWQVVDERLAQAGVTANQVQAAWVKEADAGPTSGFPAYALTLQSELAAIARILKSRFPNIALAYQSSRIYAGYASTPLNPEPYAYESGFSVKWLIESQINGDESLTLDQAPWLAWGPYPWADGLMPRSDGLTWACSELQADGTHPSATGQMKVAGMLLDFFKTDTTTMPWFLNQ